MKDPRLTQQTAPGHEMYTMTLNGQKLPGAVSLSPRVGIGPEEEGPEILVFHYGIDFGGQDSTAYSFRYSVRPIETTGYELPGDDRMLPEHEEP